MSGNVAIAVGSRVFVEYISESRTKFSGIQFKGDGVVDLFDDRYVMGRLDDGLPFMCGYADLTVTELVPEKPLDGENQPSLDQVVEYIERANSEELESISDALDGRYLHFGVISDDDDECGCDLELEAEEARKLTIIDFIERINQFGLKEGLDELRREGFMLGAHLQLEKLES